MKVGWYPLEPEERSSAPTVSPIKGRLARHNKSWRKDIMGNKPCPKIILKGTWLTFKTEIIFEFNAHPGIVGSPK